MRLPQGGPQLPTWPGQTPSLPLLPQGHGAHSRPFLSGLGPGGVGSEVTWDLCPMVSALRQSSGKAVRLFATPWTAAHQAPPPMGFSRQEYWRGLPFQAPGDLPDSGDLRELPRVPLSRSNIHCSTLPTYTSLGTPNEKSSLPKGAWLHVPTTKPPVMEQGLA